MKWGIPRRAVPEAPDADGPGADRAQGLDQALRQAVEQTAGYTALGRHGEVMQALGRALAEQGRTAEAADALHRAVLAFRADGDTPRTAGALTDWGVSLTGLGRLDVALAAHETSLELVQQLGDWRNEGIVLTNLGVTLSCARRYEEAIGAFEAAATLLTVGGLPAREAMALGGKGRALAKLGRYDEAVAALEAAAGAFRKAGDKHHEGELQAYLVITLERAGRAPRAEVTMTGPLALEPTRAP